MISVEGVMKCQKWNNCKEACKDTELNQLKWGTVFDIEGCKVKASELEEMSMDNAFWNDIQRAQDVLQQLKNYKDRIEKYDRLCSDF